MCDCWIETKYKCDVNKTDTKCIWCNKKLNSRSWHFHFKGPKQPKRNNELATQKGDYIYIYMVARC